ncbi:hypothetical protein Micbo1qcDRAFT_205051 [Microdochium bolleyi]|uniref:Uncharacterized protein n=1 Tax=Microdochium bolleyi TaxID=196109 RepID=A0A136J1W1_9PEZI|nr:hypothetical protein Micbo1qcDRAFT_205051 [Microdochium bolleyi]
MNAAAAERRGGRMGTFKMAAIDTTFALAKRSNWVEENKGPTAVFVMVGLVAIGLLGLWISKMLAKSKAKKAAAASRV